MKSSRAEFIEEGERKIWRNRGMVVWIWRWRERKREEGGGGRVSGAFSEDDSLFGDMSSNGRTLVLKPVPESIQREKVRGGKILEARER